MPKIHKNFIRVFTEHVVIFATGLAVQPHRLMVAIHFHQYQRECPLYRLQLRICAQNTEDREVEYREEVVREEDFPRIAARMILTAMVSYPTGVIFHHYLSLLFCFRHFFFGGSRENQNIKF